MRNNNVLVKRMIIIISSFLVLNCSGSFDEDFYQLNNPCNSQINQLKLIDNKISWRNALNRIIDLKDSLFIDSNISLISYEVIDYVTDENLFFIQEFVKNNSDMIPLYDSLYNVIGVTSTDSINTLHNKSVSYNYKRRDKYIDDNVRDSMLLLKLKWYVNGDVKNSYCVVSENYGIVYDNFITNTMLVNVDIAELTDKRIKSRGEDQSFSGSKTWELTATAEWLWGTERGKAVITHTCIYSNNIIIGQDSDAYAYISIGNAVAECTEIADNKISYGYGLATPLIDISLSFANGIYTVNLSSSLGSNITGSGSHTHY